MPPNRTDNCNLSNLMISTELYARPPNRIYIYFPKNILKNHCRNIKKQKNRNRWVTTLLNFGPSLCLCRFNFHLHCSTLCFTLGTLKTQNPHNVFSSSSFYFSHRRIDSLFSVIVFFSFLVLVHTEYGMFYVCFYLCSFVLVGCALAP